VSEIVAKAGAGDAFMGEALGIGGLDDVLRTVKRRVWIPLAAPPQLLDELGINPVRGLLLYGLPGCGKSLLARKLGQILSPMRPITLVSGPEILDKFVGSSEKNLREIFDNPPDIYDRFRLGEADNGKALATTALHVIVMDEFDAIARSRGGKGGAGDQGDAGVARDSVVNQLLAKMDGVDPPSVPTLVIGLTNKRSLIEPALLRPGRFEVQIEVPPPRTVEQRVSILKVHTKDMNKAGRLMTRDAPEFSPASRRATINKDNELLAYEQFLRNLAEKCKGFSGASIAAVCRAAASHALERAVEAFTHDTSDSSLLSDCVVTESDFNDALVDVLASQGDSDWSEEVDEPEIETESATSD
jgi:vesicle-fusing ATPase